MFTPTFWIYVMIGLSFGSAAAMYYHSKISFEGRGFVGFFLPITIYGLIFSPYLVLWIVVVHLFSGIFTGFFAREDNGFVEGFKLGIIPLRGFYELFDAWRHSAVEMDWGKISGSGIYK